MLLLIYTHKRGKKCLQAKREKKNERRKRETERDKGTTNAIKENKMLIYDNCSRLCRS